MADRIQGEVFQRAWKKLCRRFSRELDADEAKAYKAWLEAQGMDTEKVLQAAEVLWATREFFPRPVDFVLILGERQWEIVAGLMRYQSGDDLNGSPGAAYRSMSSAARRAYEACGDARGLLQVGWARAKQRYLAEFALAVSAEALDKPSGVLAPPRRDATPLGSSEGLRQIGSAAASIAESGTHSSPNIE